MEMEFKYPITNDEILKNNYYFKDWSLNELRNLWPQMRFFYANGFTEPETLLDNIRKEYNDKCEPGMGIIMFERDYLMAVAVKSFCGCKDCSHCLSDPNENPCSNCSRMYDDHYICEGSEIQK